MGLNTKDILREENHKQINYFPLSDRNTLTIHPVSRIPGRLYAGTKTVLHKAEKALSENSKLGFIYHTEESVDGKAQQAAQKLRPSADSFYWQTTQQQIQHAVDYGITEFSALSSKVIAAVGAYRLNVLERAYDNGIISNKYEHKEMLLRVTQARIRNLQGLERLTNAYDLGASVDDNAKRIVDTFDDYITKMQALQTDIHTNLTILTEYDREANQKLIEQINHDIGKARLFQRDILQELQANKLTKQRLENNALAATGHNSIVNFMKMRMIYALREAQEHNQNMTFSYKAGSYSRGQFNSFCEDGLKLVDAHQGDHHNATLLEHQGYFSTDPNASITLDYQRLGRNRRTTRQYLMAISNIEGADTIAKNADNEFMIITGDKIAHSLKKTKFTAWDRQSERYYHPKRLLYWGCNVFTGLVIGVLIDLPLGFFLGLAGVELVSVSTKLRLEFNPVCENETWFEKLAHKIDFPVMSLGSRVGKLVGNLLRNTVWEVFKGVTTTIKQASLQIGENLSIDYELGHKGLPDENEIFATIKKDLIKLEHEEEKIQQEIVPLFKSSKADSDKEFDKIQLQELLSRYGVAPYALSPGEWDDLLNSMLHGIKSMTESITHEIHAKHPFAGLMFTTFYFLGGLAVVSPQTLAFMGTYYLRASQAIAAASSKSVTFGATSSAIYQAQISALIPEFFVNGRNSWIVNGLTSLEDEPSTMIIYAALAVGLGTLLAYGVNIPYLSEGIRNDIGTVPIIALAATGAKFGILLVELLKVEAAENNQTISDKREKLRLFITEHFKSIYALTDEQIEASIDTILSGKLLRDASSPMKEEIRRIEFLLQLKRHEHLLPHLPYRSKRLLVELMRRQDRHQPYNAATMSDMVFPEPKQSILEVTISAILGYVPVLGRCISTIVTWDKEPWRYLAEKTRKDLSRLAHALSGTVINGIAHHIRVIVRGVFDVVINEIFARFEGLIRKDAHTLSRGTYKISAGVDSTYETLKEFFATPIDALRRAVTKPNPTGFLQRIMQKFRYGIFSKSAKPTSNPPTKNAAVMQSLDLESVIENGLMISEDEASVELSSLKHPDFKALEFNSQVLRDELANPGRNSQLNQFNVHELLQFAASDPESYPAMLRYILNDRAKREEFIQIDAVFFDKRPSPKILRYNQVPNNPLYWFLKNSEFNYEVLRDLIRKLPLHTSELINLMCLDRSGNIAIDFLTKEFGTRKSRKFLQDPAAMLHIIKHYSHNTDVLVHLRPGRKFVAIVTKAFKELVATNKTSALNMLTALTDNLSTQQAMSLFFSKYPQFFNQLKKATHDENKAVTNLVTEIRKLAELKPTSAWATIVNNIDQDLAPTPIRHAKVLPSTSLFATSQQERYQFFSKHTEALKLRLEDHDFETVEIDSSDDEDDNRPLNYAY